MYNPDRIELVLTFLFDYESRDLFNPMSFYGFSIEEQKPQNYQPLLTGTPYTILYAGTKSGTGFGDIQVDIARPRAPCEIFKDRIERIAKSPKANPATASGGPGAAAGGDKKKESDAPDEIRESLLPAITQTDCITIAQIKKYITENLGNLKKVKIEGTNTTYVSTQNKPRGGGPATSTLNDTVSNTLSKNYNEKYTKQSVSDLLEILRKITEPTYSQAAFIEHFTTLVKDDSCSAGGVSPAVSNSPGLGTGAKITFANPVNIYTILAEVYKRNNAYKYKGVNINDKSNDAIKKFKKYILEEYNKISGKTIIPSTDSDPLFTATSAVNFANAITSIFNSQKNIITDEKQVNSAINSLEYSPKPPKTPAPAPVTPPDASTIPAPTF
jgi:hypothetical protein